MVQATTHWKLTGEASVALKVKSAEGAAAGAALGVLRKASTGGVVSWRSMAAVRGSAHMHGSQFGFLVFLEHWFSHSFERPVIFGIVLGVSSACTEPDS